MHTLDSIRHAPWFNTAYKIGVGIKGVDGLVELLAGILLLISPHSPHHLLTNAAREAAEHSQSIFQLMTRQLVHLDAQLTGHVIGFVILFLIIHGVVKLGLVYALFRKIQWLYPYALGVLLVLLGIQIAPLFRHPTDLFLWLFTLLDVAIVYLVWGEYQDLKDEMRATQKTTPQ